MKLYDYIIIFLVILSVCISCDSENEVEQEHILADAKIELAEVTENHIFIYIIPDENTMSFSYAIGNKEDETAFKNETLEGIRTNSGQNRLAVEFENLKADTPYTIFVSCKNAEQKSNVKSLDVITKYLIPSVSINMVTVSQNTLTVKITPDENVSKYKYAIGSEADKDAFLNDELKGININEGNTAVEYEFTGLERNTEYMVYALGFDNKNRAGEIIGLKVITDDIYVSLNFEKICVEYITLTISPIASVDSYYILITTEYDYNSLIDYYRDWFTEAEIIMSHGFKVEQESSLLARLQGRFEYEYIVVTAAIDSYGEVIGIQKDYFSTPAYDPSLPLPSDMTVYITDNTPAGTYFRCIPGENTAGYIYGSISALSYDFLMDAGDRSYEDKVKELRSSLYGAPFGSYIGIGEKIIAYSKQTREYVLVVFPFNDNGNKGWGNMTVVRYLAPDDNETYSHVPYSGIVFSDMSTKSFPQIQFNDITVLADQEF